MRLDRLCASGRAFGLEYAQLTLELKVAEQRTRLFGCSIRGCKIPAGRKCTDLANTDPATVPEFRSAPSRALIVLISTGISPVAGILLAFFFESFQHLSSEKIEIK